MGRATRFFSPLAGSLISYFSLPDYACTSRHRLRHGGAADAHPFVAPAFLAFTVQRQCSVGNETLEQCTAAAAVVIKEKAPPITEDVVHDRFLACVEKEDANGALAHFAFIACEGGASLTLRRRQLLVLLCEKGMIKEASELLTNAVASPAFDAQDVSTIVR